MGPSQDSTQSVAPEQTSGGTTRGNSEPLAEDTSNGSAGTDGSTNDSNPDPTIDSPLSTSGDDDSTVEPVDTQGVGVNASAGCGKANPQTGSSGQPLNVSNHQYYVKLPQGYDPNTPYPVVIMFNPTGNPISWAEGAAGFETAAANWIRVYPHMANQGSGWGAGDISFFAPFYEKITSDYCMDTSRIFAAGESSGGDFVGIVGCEHADKVRAVAPCATKHVNGYDLDANARQCTGQVTAVIIHGQNDNVVGTENGPKMRDFYKELNHCEDTTTPVDGYTDTLSNCVKFEGCDPGFDTYWCNHTDPEYNGTNHGWPKFAARMLVETWSVL